MISGRNVMEKAGKSISWLSAFVTIAACIGIILFFLLNGIGEINLEFLTTEPIASTRADVGGGISTPFFGTLLLTLVGICFALPWALGTAIYLSEYAKKNVMVSFFRTAIDVLAGVPTIVIAIMGVAVFSLPQLGFLSSMVEGTSANKAFGRSFLVAGFTMAMMILPYIIKTCEEAIKTVPETFKEASLALGASKWHTIVKVVLPSAKNGIITAIILGMGRIIGDTAIVWLCLGGTLRMTGVQPWFSPENWMSTVQNTGSTLTSYIYFMSPAGEGNMTEKAMGASLILIILIVVLNLLTDVIGNINKSVMEE
ncbi:MAG: phosphate ABC transporter permease PstA [Hyphomonadaceae bacterium]|nr:phosphate ABC transporter permease PstA [Clostridia bacterium]